VNFRSGWLACVLALQVASVAWGQDASVDEQVAQVQTQDYRDKAARGLFEAGGVAFEEGRYEEALEHFKKAYELSPNRHLLLYNIASSMDRLRRDTEALPTFERYLELNPTAPNRPAVEARVRVLRQAVEEQRAEDARRQQEQAAQSAAQASAAQAAAATPATPVAEPKKSRRRIPPIVTYVGAGLTAALAGVTVWSGLNTNKARDNYESYSQDNGATFSESKRLYDDGVKRQTRTNVLAATTGVVGVATAVVAAFFTDWQGDRKTQAQVQVGLNQFQMGMSHAF
jgi:tetratricopeptide (TPR) repeat protein